MRSSPFLLTWVSGGFTAPLSFSPRELVLVPGDSTITLRLPRIVNHNLLRRQRDEDTSEKVQETCLEVKETMKQSCQQIKIAQADREVAERQ
jgi:hypothetical protein